MKGGEGERMYLFEELVISFILIDFFPDLSQLDYINGKGQHSSKVLHSHFGYVKMKRKVVKLKDR